MNSQPINRNTFFIYGALEDFCLLFGDVPAALSAFQLIGGIISARLFFDGHAYISTALVTSLLMLMLWMKGRPFNTLQSSFLQLLSLVYGFVAATSLLNAADSDGLNGYIGKSVAVKGIIIEEPFVRKEFWNTTVELQQINNYGCKGRIIAAWPADDSLSRIHKYGEEIELHGKLRRPMSARNPGAFDYRIYLLTQKVTAQIKVYKHDSVQFSGGMGGNPFIRKIVVPAREYVRSVVDKNVGEKGYLTLGILLGEKRDIPENVREDFRDTGLMHLLAVSGLNIGMLMLIAWQLASALGLGLRGRAVVSLVLIWFYATLTALSPSVLRAAIMGSVVLGGWLLERPVRSGISLLVSAYLILLFNPLTLFDVGFQLSFAAAWSIIALYPSLVRAMPESLTKYITVKWIADSLLMSLSAMAGTALILATYFNQIAFVSLIANIPAVPLSFLILAFGLALALLSWVPFLGEAYGIILDWLTIIMNRMVEIFGAIPHGYVETAAPNVITIILASLLLVTLSRISVNGWAVKFLLLLPFAAIVWYVSYELFIEKAHLKITFFDVGQADCAILRWADGTVVLVDAGGRDSSGNAADWVIKPFLRNQGIRKIDAVFLSHSDEDHAGGLPSLLKSFQVDKVFHASDSQTGNAWQEAWRYCRDNGVELCQINTGAQVFTGGDTVSVISPDLNNSYIDPNEASLTINVKSGIHSILFTGDISEGTERNLLMRNSIPDVTVLKIAHHGSKSSTTESFLDAAQPETAIISVGRFNRYGHPHKEVVSRLKMRGCNVYRTDQSGAVEMAFFRKRVDLSPLISIP